MMGVWLLGLVTFLGAPAKQPQAQRFGVMPTQFESNISGVPTKLFDEAVLSAVQRATGARVIGQADIDALIRFEDQKDLLGCEDTLCFAEIGGALGVDKLVSLRVGQVGDEWIITAKLINIRLTEVEKRATEFFPGDPSDLIRAIEPVVRKLILDEPIPKMAFRPRRPPPAAPPTPPPAAATPPPTMQPTAPATPVAMAPLASPHAVLSEEDLSQQLHELTRRLWPLSRDSDPEDRRRHAEYRLSARGKADSERVERLVRERMRRHVGDLDSITAREQYQEAIAACRRDAAAAEECLWAAALVLSKAMGDIYYSTEEPLTRACAAGSPSACVACDSLFAAYAARGRASAGAIAARLCVAGQEDWCTLIEQESPPGWASYLRTACAKAGSGADTSPGAARACDLIVRKNEHLVVSQPRFVTAIIFMTIGFAALPFFGAGVPFLAVGYLFYLYRHSAIPGSEEVAEAYRAASGPQENTAGVRLDLLPSSRRRESFLPEDSSGALIALRW